VADDNVVRVELPPLRARAEDILELVNHFTALFNEQFGRAARFDDGALRALDAYAYPGNVRELKNIVESSFVNAASDLITADDLPQRLRDGTAARPLAGGREELLHTLTATHWNISQAATRFNALLRINDVQQLKQRLTAEVGDLQRLATARQQQWRQTVEMFEARVVSLEKQMVAVQHEASLDAVTGIANRRHFEQALREALQSTPREFIVAVLDIDDFKTVNDTGGHAAGDAAARRGAARSADARVSRAVPYVFAAAEAGGGVHSRAAGRAGGKRGAGARAHVRLPSQAGGAGA
jgi:DNA-binding NtrC family response regulator